MLSVDDHVGFRKLALSNSPHARGGDLERRDYIVMSKYQQTRTTRDETSDGASDGEYRVRGRR